MLVIQRLCVCASEQRVLELRSPGTRKTQAKKKSSFVALALDDSALRTRGDPLLGSARLGAGGRGRGCLQAFVLQDSSLLSFLHSFFLLLKEGGQSGTLPDRDCCVAGEMFRDTVTRHDPCWTTWSERQHAARIAAATR